MAWLDNLRNVMGVASGAMKGFTGNAPSPIGNLAQSTGAALGSYRARKAMNQNEPLHSAVDQAVKMAPAPITGPAPIVPPAPWTGPMPAGSEPNPAQMDDQGFDSYADGKVVSKPTLAVIGEQGPEAVVPLGYRAHAKVRPSVAMGMEQVRRRPRFYGEA